MITKGERTELRSIVRQQFKVLRAEVIQRQAELYAEVDEEIAGRYSEQDLSWDALMHEVHEATMEANRRVNDALTGSGYQIKNGSERMWFSTPMIQKPVADRNELRHRAASRITAQVKAALLRLDRDEADMLRSLAVGALESAEAQAFLSSIPSVADLVSGARLAELESQFKDES